MKENKQIQIVVAQLLHKKIMPNQVYKAIFRHILNSKQIQTKY